MDWKTDLWAFLLAGVAYWIGFLVLFLLDSLDIYNRFIKKWLKKWKWIPRRYSDMRKQSRFPPIVLRGLMFLALFLGAFSAYRDLAKECRADKRQYEQSLRDHKQDNDRLRGRLEDVETSVESRLQDRMERESQRLTDTQLEHTESLTARDGRIQELENEVGSLRRTVETPRWFSFQVPPPPDVPDAVDSRKIYLLPGKSYGPSARVKFTCLCRLITSTNLFVVPENPESYPGVYLSSNHVLSPTMGELSSQNPPLNRDTYVTWQVNSSTPIEGLRVEVLED